MAKFEKMSLSARSNGQNNREFKVHVSGNGKRQVRTFLATLLNVFVSYFLSRAKRITVHCCFKTASSFNTLYCPIPKIFSLPGVCRLTYNAKLNFRLSNVCPKSCNINVKIFSAYIFPNLLII